MNHHPIQKLRHLIGTWNCEEIYHAGGWVPQEIRTQTATDVFRWGPGGFSILADYSSDSDVFGRFEAVDLFLWDEQKQKYLFIIAYNYNALHEIQEGYMPDDTHIIFENPSSFNGKEGTMRRTFTIEERTSQLLLEFEDKNGAKTKIVTINKSKVD